jgi:hypothetical protein
MLWLMTRLQVADFCSFLFSTPILLTVLSMNGMFYV